MSLFAAFVFQNMFNCWKLWRPPVQNVQNRSIKVRGCILIFLTICWFPICKWNIFYLQVKTQLVTRKDDKKSRKTITGNLGNFARQRVGLKNSDKSLWLDKNLFQVTKSAEFCIVPPTRPVGKKTLFYGRLTNRKKSGRPLFRILAQGHYIRVSVLLRA